MLPYIYFFSKITHLDYIDENDIEVLKNANHNDN